MKVTNLSDPSSKTSYRLATQISHSLWHLEHSHVISVTAPPKYQSTKVNAKSQF